MSDAWAGTNGAPSLISRRLEFQRTKTFTWGHMNLDRMELSRRPCGFQQLTPGRHVEDRGHRGLALSDPTPSRRERGSSTTQTVSTFMSGKTRPSGSIAYSHLNAIRCRNVRGKQDHPLRQLLQRCCLRYEGLPTFVTFLITLR